MQNRKLLIVDDDQQVRETLQHIAEFSGYEVITTDTAFSFFEQLSLFEPDIIIVDLVMPPPGGGDIIRRLAELHSDARLILTSGLGERALAAAAETASELDLVVLGTLEKPFSVQKLRQLLQMKQRADLRPRRQKSWFELLKSSDTLPSNDELINVVENDLITLSYQPKLSCATGRLLGFEALARWDLPESGSVIPSVFVPLAENFDLIEELTYNTFRHGLRWLNELRRSGPASLRGQSDVDLANMTLAFNISADLLSHVDLPEQLGQLCSDAGIPPSAITLEISEDSVMHDPVPLLDVLNRFDAIGFQLSIDDFGTGFSSLLHLVRMPFDELKIDRLFVGTAAESEESLLVVRSAIELAHSLGMETVAEGVESESVRQMLVKAGCTAFQGYLVSPPLRPEEAGTWIQRYCEQPVHES